MRTRPVEADDAAALLAIFNPEVTEEAVSFDLVPRTLTDQAAWIAEHQGAYLAIVAIGVDDAVGEHGARGEPVVGFASVSPFRSRPAYSTTVENSVYVHRAARGLGVGHLLLSDLCDAARTRGFHSVIARIVGENEASIRLHEGCGFSRVGVEREVGRKHGRWLDVIEMQCLL